MNEKMYTIAEIIKPEYRNATDDFRRMYWALKDLGLELVVGECFSPVTDKSGHHKTIAVFDVEVVDFNDKYKGCSNNIFGDIDEPHLSFKFNAEDLTFVKATVMGK